MLEYACWVVEEKDVCVCSSQFGKGTHTRSFTLSWLWGCNASLYLTTLLALDTRSFTGETIVEHLLAQKVSFLHFLLLQSGRATSGIGLHHG